MHHIVGSKIYGRLATRVSGARRRIFDPVHSITPPSAPRPISPGARRSPCRVLVEYRQVRQAALGTRSSRETKVWACVIGEVRVMPRGNAGREMNPLISVAAQCA